MCQAYLKHLYKYTPKLCLVHHWFTKVYLNLNICISSLNVLFLLLSYYVTFVYVGV